MGNGELFVMTRGVHQMLGWPVDSLASQEQVSFTQVLAIHIDSLGETFCSQMLKTEFEFSHEIIFQFSICWLNLGHDSIYFSWMKR